MNNLTNFNDLFSQMRLSSYNDDIIKHYDNLKLVGKITPKIATLEIIPVTYTHPTLPTILHV
ncbi:hypothetical protein ACISN4_09715 [Campylobacter jejuni]